MPRSVSAPYSRNLNDFSIDPRLAEALELRKDRLNTRFLDQLKDSGKIQAEGIEKMGNTLSEGVKAIPREYRAGKDWRQGYEIGEQKRKSGGIDLKHKQFDDQMLDEMRNTGGESEESYSPKQTMELAPTQSYETTRTERTIQPERSFSPGAAAVLDGRAKAGFNQAIKSISEESNAPPFGEEVQQNGVVYRWNPNTRKYE